MPLVEAPITRRRQPELVCTKVNPRWADNLRGIFDPRSPTLIGPQQIPRIDSGPVKLVNTPGVGWGLSYTSSGSSYSAFEGVVRLNKFPQTLLVMAQIEFTTANMRIAGTYKATTQGFSVSPASSEVWRLFNNVSPATGGGSDTYVHTHIGTAQNGGVSQLDYYIDGSYVSSSGAGDTGTSSTGIYIGATGGTPAVYLDGIVYLVALWTRLLSVGEITMLSKNPWQIFAGE